MLDNGLKYLFRKLAARDDLDIGDREVITAAINGTRSYHPREILVHAEVPLTHSILLLEGFVCRRRDMLDGSRMILELHVPGDFIDLHGYVLKRLEHDIAALSAARVAIVPHARLDEIMRGRPRLARKLWFTTLVDAAIYREWIVTIGRRDALARIAHLFCELEVRLGLAGLVEDGHFALPIVQADVADATGLTPIHVNRMLKRLRDMGAMTFRDGRVTVHDRALLARVADFDPGYLFIDAQSRADRMRSQ